MRRGTRTLGAAAAIAALACEGATVEEVCPDGIGKQAEAVVEARCFDQVLAVDTDPSSSEHGRVPCKLYVLLPPGSDGCACDAEGYAPAPSPPDTVASALGQYCADPCCKDMCVCEFLQLAGPELVACQSGTETSQWPVGWCYVSPEQGIGNPELVEDCPLDDKRLLRTVPNRHAVKGVLTCQSDVVILESEGG